VPKAARWSRTRRPDKERALLWERWRSLAKNLDGYLLRRSTETAVVVLEPRQQQPV